MRTISGWLVLLYAVLALGGCGNDRCEDATEKVLRCSDTVDVEGSNECEDTEDECAAECTNHASCEEIGAMWDDGEINSYTECLFECG